MTIILIMPFFLVFVDWQVGHEIMLKSYQKSPFLTAGGQKHYLFPDNTV